MKICHIAARSEPYEDPFTALFRARDKPQDSVSSAPTFYFGTSGSGKPVNANTAIQLSTVYACVRVISETVASLPLGVYEAEKNGNRKATEHPLYRLLHDEPNSEMTSFVLREVMMAHLLPWGNSYSQIIRSGRNQVTGLYPLLPELQKQLAGIELGKPETVGRKLKPILKNSLIFGSDLTATPLADRIEAYFLEEIEGPGAVRNTLHKYLN